MVLQMIDLNPSLRPTFDTLLTNSKGTAFPSSFYDFYHGYVNSILELPSPSPFAYTFHHPSTTSLHAYQAGRITQLSMPGAADGTATPTSAGPSVFSAGPHTIAFPNLPPGHPSTTNFAIAATAPGTSVTPDGHRHEKGASLPRDSDRRIDMIWEEFERVVPWLNKELRDDDGSAMEMGEISHAEKPKQLHVSVHSWIGTAEIN